MVEYWVYFRRVCVHVLTVEKDAYRNMGLSTDYLFVFFLFSDFPVHLFFGGYFVQNLW